jgi:hypothetical protein
MFYISPLADNITGTKRWYEMNKTPLPVGYEKEQW